MPHEDVLSPNVAARGDHSPNVAAKEQLMSPVDSDQENPVTSDQENEVTNPEQFKTVLEPDDSAL